MTTRIFLVWTLKLLIVYLFQLNTALPTSGGNCPSDCVCYKDYMSNLASWKWIETDINTQKDDPEHEDFNPYTDHNDVFDNPAAVRKRQNERMLDTITCILRSNATDALRATFKSLPITVQVLSLMQAPGSGNITLEKAHLENLHSLIGLEVQGYNSLDEANKKDILVISADAFAPLKRLKYLNMDTIDLLQRSVENEVHTEMTRTVLRFNYQSDGETIDDIPSSQVILLEPLQDEGENAIVPYSVFKSEPRAQPQTVKPKIAVAFTRLPNLQHLKISGCNLQDISWDMFYKLDNLKFLLLDQNDLLFLPDFVFFATSNLTALSLSRNRILNLQTVGLAGLLYLQKLDVSNNNITHLSELSLPPFPHLEVADFRHNPIESIFPNTFEIMNSTKTLFLGSLDTPIQFLPNSFYGLVSLTRLDILNVRIGFLERPMFSGMPELRSLTMTGAVTRISYDAFSEVAKLEKLVLKECAIRKISMDAFFGLSSLVELDLSHNEIAFLPPGIFDQQASLREVFLQHNKLKTLPSSIFAKIPAKLIRLEGNPWHCSCDMKYWDSQLTNRVKRYYVPQPNVTLCQKQYDKGSMCFGNYDPTLQVKYAYEKRVSPVCKAPEKFSGRSVFEVLRKELHYCANSLQKNISKILTATNPTETIEKMRQTNLSGSLPLTARQIEKLLLSPPKVPKPAKANVSNPNSSNELNQLTNDIVHSSMVNSFPILVTNVTLNNTAIEVDIPRQSTSDKISEADATPFTPQIKLESNSTIINRQSNLRNIEPEIISTKPPKQKSNKSKKNGNKKRNQDRERDRDRERLSNNHAVENNNILTIFNNRAAENNNIFIMPNTINKQSVPTRNNLPISKKSLKFHQQIQDNKVNSL